MQSNPTLEPSFITNTALQNLTLTGENISAFVGLSQIENTTHWLKAFERSVIGFIPPLEGVSPPSGAIKITGIDYVIKIVGGALTFGLLIVALRRKFERKYTR
jgi:hypothetical protein